MYGKAAEEKPRRSPDANRRGRNREEAITIDESTPGKALCQSFFWENIAI
jgi:hypothetical protein